MSDRNARDELSLAEALRALPLAAPPRDVWQTLAAELAPQRRPSVRRRFALPAALAAGVLALVVAVLLAQRQQPAVPVATVTPPAASNVANGANAEKDTSGKATSGQVADPALRLAALEARSQELERWLRETRDAAAPLPGQDLAASAEIEDLIGLVDMQLGGSSGNQALPLWQHRVDLLEDLTALRYSNYRLAETLSSTASGAAPNPIN